MNEQNLAIVQNPVVEASDLVAIVHELTDRAMNTNSTREHEAMMVWLFQGGARIKDIAAIFGKSYEWTRRIVKNVAYDYVENDAVLN